MVTRLAAFDETRGTFFDKGLEALLAARAPHRLPDPGAISSIRD